MVELPPYRCIRLTQEQYAFVDEADFEWLNQWLRPVTPHRNATNRKMPVTNTSGCMGVKYVSRPHEKRRPWVATIKIRGRVRYLGYFERKEDAIAARLDGAARYYGAFVRSGAPDIPSVIFDTSPRANSVRNSSGFAGVDFRKNRTTPWRARVRIDNIVHHIGHFDSPEKASLAREKFLQTLQEYRYG
jgi:hypothetical protein